MPSMRLGGMGDDWVGVTFGHFCTAMVGRGLFMIMNKILEIWGSFENCHSWCSNHSTELALLPATDGF